LPFLYDVLPGQPRIDHRAQRHPTVGLGLELHHQQKIGVPAGFRRNAPYHVAVATGATATLELGVDALHRAQIQVVHPRFGDELAQRLRHHAGMAKKVVVHRIVPSHAAL
jgi:hypothetical protein